MNPAHASDPAREYAISKAQELQATLGADYPSFVKRMVCSHVTAGFWLGLPARFCKEYLPKDAERTTLTLVDEADVEMLTCYLPLRAGLCAGWRAFSLGHGLVDGDCLVFQLINPTTFRVYIIRQSSYYENLDED